MFNFHITFEHPWLLFLLIPAFALVLIPYFLIAKKYRRNRNRITSAVLSCIVMTLAVFVLSGIGFAYEIHNPENEIIFLVDASYSTQESQDAKNEYLRNTVDMTDSNTFRVGVVTFGFTQNYAVPLTNRLGDVYMQYLNAEPPQTDATDIASALLYTKDLFTVPQSAKIVVVSDGLETDEKARTAVETVLAAGIRVDTVICSSYMPESEVQLGAVTLPDYNISVGDVFPIALDIISRGTEKQTVTVTFFDNGEVAATQAVEITPGTQQVVFRHTLTQADLHEFQFTITRVSDRGDTIEENNSVYSFLYLESFENILMLEKFEGQSDGIKGLLEESGYKVTLLNIGDERVPSDIETLRQYDEVVLNNIANADMPEGFVALLDTYVSELGGGLFTVGGGEGNDLEVAHAYNHEDMAGTDFQDMLPVEAIDYTPPLGLSIVIDVSGSMSGESIEAAKNSARTIIRDGTCLSERDYCAVYALSDTYAEVTSPLPMTRQYEILESINGLTSKGGTLYTPTIEQSGRSLLALYNNGLVEKMHVIVISDGGVSSEDTEYKARIKSYYDRGVTFSFVGINASSSEMEVMQEAANLGGGHAFNATLGEELTQKLKDDIRVPEIKDVQYGSFVPKFNEKSSFSHLIKQDDIPTFEGFYGTKARNESYGVEVVLEGDFRIPVYAQWKYGVGTVGSLMTALYGEWGEGIINSEGGRKFLTTAVAKILPTENIRHREIEIGLVRDNYGTNISLYPREALEEGETLSISVSGVTNENAVVTVVQPSEAEAFTRASFKTAEAGVYRITVERRKGDEVFRYSVYEARSYSDEYDAFSTQNGSDVMIELASLGDGVALDIKEASANPSTVFVGFQTSFHLTHDPRLWMMIVAAVLFLLDIAVRKFKFKWPHEIIRELREKRDGKGANVS